MANEKLKVLLVDDDEIIQIYLRDIFWIYGFENRCDLAIASNLDQAEHIVGDPATRPDVIFLDLALPKRVEDRTLIDPKYSFEFLRRMKTEPEFKNIKVLIFSGHSEKEFEDEAKKDGADAYIHKSESLPKDLVVVVTNLLKDFKK